MFTSVLYCDIISIYRKGVIKITEQEKNELNKIATKINYTLRERGNLETQNNDDKDFVNIAVWELKEMLEEAYNLGKLKGV